MPMSHIPIACLATSAAFTMPVMATEAVLNESSLVPVGIAVTCCLFLCALIWKASATLTRIEDRLNQIEQDQKTLPCKAPCDLVKK